MGDQAQQEERVLQWLKKRGYTEVAKHYEEEQQQPGEEGDEGGDGQLKRRVGEATQNALLFRSVQLVHACADTSTVWCIDCVVKDRPTYVVLTPPPPASSRNPTHTPLPQSDPSIFHRSYNELQTWICNALEAYKPELLTVSFPVRRPNQWPACLLFSSPRRRNKKA